MEGGFQKSLQLFIITGYCVFEDDVCVDLLGNLDRKPNCGNSLHSLLHPFTDLIIGEAAYTPSSNPFFAGLYHATDASEVR